MGGTEPRNAVTHPDGRFHGGETPENRGDGAAQEGFTEHDVPVKGVGPGGQGEVVQAAAGRLGRGKPQLLRRSYRRRLPFVHQR